MSQRLRIAPWQVWLVDFGQPIGHEQGGLRPSVVVGSSVHCRFPIDMAIVVPLTPATAAWTTTYASTQPSPG